jgi:hypothetical protein
MTAMLLAPRTDDAEPSGGASIVVTLFPLLLLVPLFVLILRLVKRSHATQERAQAHMEKMEALTERMVALLEASHGTAPSAPESHSHSGR